MNPVADYQEMLDGIIREMHEDPIDLLNIGDDKGEASYIRNSRLSYLRTLRDVIRMARSLKAEPRQFRILEIGAYLGVVSCTLARLGFTVTAQDIPEFMDNERLQARFARFGVATLSANLRDYSIPSGSGRFDLVIMCETLEHLNFNPLPVMAQVNRVLSPGGHLYLSLPNLASLVNRVKLLTGRSIHNPIRDFSAQLGTDCNMIVGIHWREYAPDELRELVEWGGFQIVRHDFFTTNAASLPARLVYLWAPRLRGNQTLVARKNAEVTTSFQFCNATR